MGKRIVIILLATLIFLVGYVTGGIYHQDEDGFDVVAYNFDPQDAIKKITEYSLREQHAVSFLSPVVSDIPSPYDHIKEDQITVTDRRVILNIEHAEWAAFTDTNSMDPVIDAESHAIEIVPDSPEDIHVGDIVSYQSCYIDGPIIHRVIDIGYDTDGWFARFKGDNNDIADPEKVRFSQIERILVAIIY